MSRVPREHRAGDAWSEEPERRLCATLCVSARVAERLQSRAEQNILGGRPRVQCGQCLSSCKRLGVPGGQGSLESRQVCGTSELRSGETGVCMEGRSQSSEP